MEEALRREVKEETGLEVKPIIFLNLQEAIYSKEFHEPKHFIFLDCLCQAQTTDVRVDKDELQEFIWVEPQKALKMNVDSFTRKTISKYLQIKDFRS